MKVKQAYKSVAPKELGIIGVIDTQDNNKFKEIGITHSWNVQQGCMAQWMGPDFETKILYNDFRDGHYCAVIYNFKEQKEESVLPMAAYDVARDGSFILSLDFSRLHRMRPGYGYSNLPDMTKGELCPNKGCIWKVDIGTGEVTELFKYTDFASFEPDESMLGAEHKVNHLMISPNCKRFMVLHRWFQKGRKHTRLVTVNVDKTEMYNLKPVYNYVVVASSITKSYKANALDISSRILKSFSTFIKEYDPDGRWNKAYYALIIRRFEECLRLYFFSSKNEKGTGEILRELRSVMKSEPYMTAAKNVEVEKLLSHHRKVARLMQYKSAIGIWLLYKAKIFMNKI